MKYRLKSVRRKNIYPSLPELLPPACRYESTQERINIDALFEAGELPMPPKAPKRPRKSIKKRLNILKQRACTRIGALCSRIREHRKKAHGKYQRISFYFGVLCSVATVALLSVAVVLVGLFGSFLMPYRTVSYPHFTGKQFTESEASIEKSFDVTVSYRYSDTFPAGTVISQSPNGGVTRKLYDSKKKAPLSLTVSAGRSFYTVETLEGLTLRDARLLLKNADVSIKSISEYSDTAPIGTVISSVPSSGSKVYSGEAITLKISLGKKILLTKIPELYGLGESQARLLITSRKLTVGKISYVSSDADAGKVIAQSPHALESVPEGTEVTLTVSLGKAQQKSIPDLYGLNTAQAKEKLSEYGLVIGNIFTVESAAAAGCVVTQSPRAGTFITSSINAVDIYISS